MPSSPRFNELQAVRLLPPAEHLDWPKGIIVDRRWEEAGQHWRTNEPYEARWIYEVQVGDPGKLFEIWMKESDLTPRQPPDNAF